MIDDKKLIEVMDNINLKHDQEAPAGALPENVDLTFVSVAEEPKVMEGDNGSNNWYPVTFKDASGSTYDLSLKSLINGVNSVNVLRLGTLLMKWVQMRTLANSTSTKSTTKWLR